MITFKQTAGVHLTATDKRLIKASIENDNQNVGTRDKKLTIVSVDGDNVDAVLHSFEVGIGIGAKKSWIGRKISYKITSK